MEASAQTYTYKEIVERTKEGIPTFAPLYKFLEDGQDTVDCKITLVEFENDNQKLDESKGEPEERNGIELRKIEKSALENELKQLGQTEGHRLLLVENLTPTVITLLGEYWKVPPDFFLAHLENSNWYNLLNIPQNLPGLSSVQSLNGYVRFQFIGPRELEIKDFPDPQRPGSTTDHDQLPDRIHEDPKKASVPRVAGGFTPFPPHHIDPEDLSETKLHPVAFVRNSITIWFDKEGDKWKKGIVLFDPPFEAKDKRFSKRENSKYRSFIPRRPPPYFSDDDIDHRISYKESFEKCLKKNKHIQEPGLPRPFVLLEDLCRIIASEWLVFNTYIERELNTIEGWFEELGENCDSKQLHDLLHQLMRARRRVTKYDTLVSDQLQLCPAHWRYESIHDLFRSTPTISRPATPKGLSPPMDFHQVSNDLIKAPYDLAQLCPASGIAQSTSLRFSSPLKDFHQVSNHLTHNKIRISQAIKMVTSLMAVRLNKLMVQQNDVVAAQSKVLVEQNGLMVKQNDVVAAQSTVLVEQNGLIVKQNEEVAKQSKTMFRQNKLSEARNSSLAFLTGVTTVLLPFTTIAAYMAIPSESGLGPGSKGQWKYWITSGLLATVLIVAFLLDYRWQSWNVNHEGENNHRIFSWLLPPGKRKKNNSQA